MKPNFFHTGYICDGLPSRHGVRAPFQTSAEKGSCSDGSVLPLIDFQSSRNVTACLSSDVHCAAFQVPTPRASQKWPRKCVPISLPSS